MGIVDWYKTMFDKLQWYDVSFVKLSSMAFALMVAKLWSPILSLDWYWYLVLSLVFAVKPLMDVFG